MGGHWGATFFIGGSPPGPRRTAPEKVYSDATKIAFQPLNFRDVTTQ